MYVKLDSGVFRYRHPARTVNGRMRHFYAVVDAKPEHHPEALYYLQFSENGKLQYEKLSGDPAEMLAAQCRKETLLQATADGLVA